MFTEAMTYLQTAGNNYVLTSFVFLRLLGFVYFIAFISLATQVLPLIGEKGLTPAKSILVTSSKLHAFFSSPTIFWFHLSDNALLIGAWLGIILSFIVMVGYANVPILLVLWLLYMSYVTIGQLWYSFGWELQLLETGFLSMFLVPLLDVDQAYAPPIIVVWLFRWLAFRIYLGAGLIKIRGDSCWRDLTCLYYHYETQPLPNPLSRWLHFMPKWFHQAGVLFNHFVELIVPWFVFAPVRQLAGFLMIFFQGILMTSGNLSFLNVLTILPCIFYFDDDTIRLWASWMPKEMSRIETSFFASYLTIGLLLFIAYLSVPVIINLLSSRQIMNTSFTNFHLVNTYGAFGSIGKERYELIIEGTTDAKITSRTKWTPYDFKAKPGDVDRSLPIIAPYQPRLDWQIWFAAMGGPEYSPWVLLFIHKLLENDEGTLSLLANNPFSEKPPRYIRVQHYKYHFIPPWKKGVWEREYIGTWLPPLSKKELYK